MPLVNTEGDKENIQKGEKKNVELRGKGVGEEWGEEEEMERKKGGDERQGGGGGVKDAPGSKTRKNITDLCTNKNNGSSIKRNKKRQSISKTEAVPFLCSFQSFVATV